MKLCLPELMLVHDSMMSSGLSTTAQRSAASISVCRGLREGKLEPRMNEHLEPILHLAFTQPWSQEFRKESRSLVMKPPKQSVLLLDEYNASTSFGKE